MFTIPQIAINILTSSGINWYLKSIQNAIESEKNSYKIYNCGYIKSYKIDK